MAVEVSSMVVASSSAMVVAIGVGLILVIGDVEEVL